MPECNICRSPYLEGQAFCKSCGARFSTQEPDRVFCSRCGAPTLLNQEKCPECGLRLRTQPLPPLKEELSRRPFFPKEISRLFLYGLAAGLVLLVVVLLVWSFTKGSPGILSLKGGEGKPAASASQAAQGNNKSEVRGPVTGETGADANAVLKSQLEALLVAMKEANQKKDLDAFLNAYSPNFPHLAQKRRTTQRIWAIYDYLDMKFTIEEAQLLAPDRAFARITWEIDSENRWTKKIRKVTKTYRVWFIKEADQWRIRTLEKASPTWAAGKDIHAIVEK